VRSQNHEVGRVSAHGVMRGADLGGSSKYSTGNFEDWSGKRFHV